MLTLSPDATTFQFYRRSPSSSKQLTNILQHRQSGYPVLSDNHNLSMRSRNSYWTLFVPKTIISISISDPIWFDRDVAIGPNVVKQHWSQRVNIICRAAPSANVGSNLHLCVLTVMTICSRGRTILNSPPLYREWQPLCSNSTAILCSTCEFMFKPQPPYPWLRHQFWSKPQSSRMSLVIYNVSQHCNGTSVRT